MTGFEKILCNIILEMIKFNSAGWYICDDVWIGIKDTFWTFTIVITKTFSSSTYVSYFSLLPKYKVCLEWFWCCSDYSIPHKYFYACYSYLIHQLTDLVENFAFAEFVATICGFSQPVTYGPAALLLLCMHVWKFPPRIPLLCSSWTGEKKKKEKQ